jgi:GTP-binding protein Era
MKSGTVAIVGRPNVGKSTLINTLIKEKIAIVSNKPQTTRTRILGVLHRPDAEILFLDTPGIHQPQDRLNRRMVRVASESLQEADLIYVLADATSLPGPGERLVKQRVAEVIGADGPPVFLLLNKVDLVNRAKLLPIIDVYSKVLPWAEMVPISAKTGINVEKLIELTVQALPEGDPAFGEDTFTDQTMRTLAAELIREKILHKTWEELPYGVAVTIDEFKEEGKLARITATIFVSKKSHKPMIIGKGGNLLKEMATEARKEMEQIFGMKVFLQLWVKVEESWRDDDSMLVDLGY